MDNSERNLKVLIVDDQPELLGVLKEILTSEQFAVETAANGKIALDMIRKQSYDLMISDIGMPVMDGWQLVEASKQYRPEMMIILISSWKNEDTEKRQRQSSVSTIIHKPFRVTELFDEIKRLDLYHSTNNNQSMKIG